MPYSVVTAQQAYSTEMVKAPYFERKFHVRITIYTHKSRNSILCVYTYNTKTYSGTHSICRRCSHVLSETRRQDNPQRRRHVNATRPHRHGNGRRGALRRRQGPGVRRPLQQGGPTRDGTHQRLPGVIHLHLRYVRILTFKSMRQTVLVFLYYG